jgi:hypothetical protein
MKTYLIVVLFIMPCFALAQRKEHFKAPKIFRYVNGYNNCSYQYRFNANKRRSFFPFSEAAHIRLISFQEGENLPINITEPGLPNNPAVILAEDTMQVFSPMTSNNFVVNYCRVKEMRDLSKAAVDSLTDLLYNVKRKPLKIPDDITFIGPNCYMPLNAILFMDDKWKVIGYFEICFDCHKYYYSSIKTREIDYCDQKWDMLKQYFRYQGIRFGVATAD